MHVEQWIALSAVPVSEFLPACGLWSYVGLGPGPDLLPALLALLSFIGMALAALVQWPLAVLLDRLSKVVRRRREGTDHAATADPGEDRRNALENRGG